MPRSRLKWKKVIFVPGPRAAWLLMFRAAHSPWQGVSMSTEAVEHLVVQTLVLDGIAEKSRKTQIASFQDV